MITRAIVVPGCASFHVESKPGERIMRPWRSVFAALSMVTLFCFVMSCSDDDQPGTDGGVADTGAGDTGAGDTGVTGDSAAGGPIDGVWKVTSFKCDTDAQQIGEFVLTVNNTSGTFVQGFGPNCIVTLQETYSYPDSSTFKITPTAVACDPNTECKNLPPFQGQDCVPLPPATEFSYTRSGDTLTFTRTASGPGDAPCTTGQTVEFVLQKQ